MDRQDEGCFKCGKPGHFARDCWATDRGGMRGRGRGNYQGRGEEMSCYQCGRPGHFARDCRSRDGPSRRRGIMCYTCNEEGHVSRDCPNTVDDGAAGDMTCYKCGRPGHFARDCRSTGGREGRRQITCYNCDEEGHIARDCPHDRKPRDRGVCYQCGKQGHLARDCTAAAAPGTHDDNNDINEELGNIFSELWNLDDNRCNPGEDYDIDMQGALHGTNTGKDLAEQHLFKRLDEGRVFKRPTYKAFRNLLDNYEMEVGTCEDVTDKDKRENETFLRAVMQTAVMERAHEYLVQKGLADSGEAEFKEKLDYLWFQLYNRKARGCKDSSGFEHVFVGEVKGDDVIGLHNWIQFYLQEQKGNIDYKGFFKRGTSEEMEDQPRLITLQFTWKDWQTKPKGSTLLGISPEFELAIYTIAFLTMGKKREEKIRTNIGPYTVDLTCHKFAHDQVGSIYIKAVE